MSKVNPPRMVSEIDFEESRGYLDTPDFIQYCLEVQTVIESLSRPMIADMKRALGDKLKSAWLIDALESLMAVGSIEQVAFVSPLRWASRAMRAAPEKRGWMYQSASIESLGR